jgi:site-specific recombinase XerD
MGHKIETVTARAKLKVRREPYWQRISKGFHVGFRKMSGASSGTWVLRHVRDDGHEIEHSLGTLDGCPDHRRFDQAVEQAREWLGRGAPDEDRANRPAPTVMDACDAYVNRIRELKGKEPADDLEARYRRWVRSDPIHSVELAKLTREHLDNYRRRLLAAPVKTNTAGTLRERSKDTVNRDMAALRAALNRALADRIVTTDFAWREPLKAYKNASKRRGLYLDRQQRRNFIDQASEDLAPFLEGLSILPLRPGALAALTVEDFDCRLHVLRIGTDKSGADRKIKLPTTTAKLFEKAGANRPPTAPLLARADGQAWNKDAWKKPVKEAAKNAGLPLRTTAYTLRHSVITDLVHDGLDLLTVAQISGTSVAMIEKHYGHLRREIATEALARLAL